MEKIDWKRYVDKTYVISYIKNYDNRKFIENEFKRIGISDYEFKLSIDNKILDHLKEDYNTESISGHGLYVTNTHYETIKEAYELGYGKILMFEDDVVFLNDTTKILYELEIASRSRANISMFDYISYDTGPVDEDGFETCLYQLSSAYMLDRIGMEYMIKRIEHNFLTIDYYFGNDGQVFYDASGNLYHTIEYYNPFDFEVTYSIPFMNRICVQSKMIDGIKKFDRYIYYDSNISNDNRSDPVISEETAYSEYNFEQ